MKKVKQPTPLHSNNSSMLVNSKRGSVEHQLLESQKKQLLKQYV